MTYWKINFRKTHCVQGHEFNQENTYIYPKTGRRACRTCRHSAVLRVNRAVNYKVWDAMMQRCFNPNAPNYKNYGGRGITVCDAWRKYRNFIADMGPRPPGKTKKGKAAYSLERKDVNGNYCPENCIWATWREQIKNERRFVEGTAARNKRGVFVRGAGT